MRLKIAAFLLVMATAGLVRADVDSTLAALQDVGKKLKEFSSDIRLTEDDGLGNNRVKAGKVYFQRTADGSARIHVIFDKRISKGQIRDGEKTEYLLEDRFLTDRNYRTKSQVKREVLQPGEKLDLFKIGKGPFPLPIGQDPAEVKHAFDVKLIPPGKDDPANTAHVLLTPKPGTQLAGKFKSIDIWVDNVSHMPVRVDNVDKNGTVQSTALINTVLNPPKGLKATDFELPKTEGDWANVIEPFQK